MPGETGIEVCQRIRSDPELAGTPVLMLSALETSTDSRVQGLDAGADAYLVRPVAGRELVAWVRAMLRIKRAEAQIAYQADLLTHVHDAVIAWDEQLLARSWNRAAEAMFGWTAEEVVGRPAEQFLRTDFLGVEPPAVARILAETGAFRGEAIQSRKDGMRFPVELTITALRRDGGRIAGYVSVNRDITERKQAEEEIQRLNGELEQRVRDRTAELQAANKELEAFCHSVSHDLRAPLRAIDGFSQALLEDYTDRLDAQGQHFLKRVRRATTHMGHLIDDLLGLSRVTRTEMQWQRVDLSALAETIAAELQKTQPDRQVQFVITPALVTRGDRRLLRLVLENLLGNAWKYTSRHSQARIELGKQETDGRTVYFVRDDGAGFDMAYADKLFGAFQRLHAAAEFEGTGIGLATVQRILHRHGGRIWAEGAVERGATVYFTV
jgi:PAS domain S-box-containing protein